MNPHMRYPRDTDKEGQWDPLAPWYGRVYPTIVNVPPGIAVLDVGCNSGGMGRAIMARQWATFYGVDLARHLLPRALAKGYKGVAQAFAESLPFRAESFDVVICSEILEHADNPEAVVREAHRVLRPGGLLLGDVPTWFGRWGCRSLRGHKWHRRFYSRHQLRRLLRPRFTIEHIRYAFASLSAGYILPQWETFQCRKLN